MKIGIHSWVLETRHPLVEAIRLAGEIGYDGYEIDIGNFGGTRLGLQILPDRMSDASRREIKAAQTNSGVEICSLCLGALWHYPLAGSDETYRQRGVEITRATVSLASFLGADCILLPLGQPQGVSAREAWANSRRSLESCLGMAAEAGVVLALENVCSDFLRTAGDLARMVDEIGSPFCRVYYDVANNAWLGLDPAAEIRALGARIARIHVKNRTSLRGAGNSVVNSVGQPGIVDFAAVKRAMQDIGYDGYLIVEVPTFNQDADLVARQNLAATRALLA